MYPLDQVDHLTMLTEDGTSVNCFCGAFRSEWLPVSLRTWTPLKLVYSIPHYSWSTKGFSFKSSYSFNNDALCGSKTFTTHSGTRLERERYTFVFSSSFNKIWFCFSHYVNDIFNVLFYRLILFIVLLLWHKSPPERRKKEKSNTHIHTNVSHVYYFVEGNERIQIAMAKNIIYCVLYINCLKSHGKAFELNKTYVCVCVLLLLLSFLLLFLQILFSVFFQFCCSIFHSFRWIVVH